MIVCVVPLLIIEFIQVYVQIFIACVGSIHQNKLLLRPSSLETPQHIFCGLQFNPIMMAQIIRFVNLVVKVIHKKKLIRTFINTKIIIFYFYFYKIKYNYFTVYRCLIKLISSPTTFNKDSQDK